MQTDKENTTGTVTIPDVEPEGLCNKENGTINGDPFQGPLLVFTWNWHPSAKTDAIDVKSNIVKVQFKADGDGFALSQVSGQFSLDNAKIFPNAANPSKSDTIK